MDGGEDNRGLWGFLVAVFGTFATGLFGVLREGRKGKATGDQAEANKAKAKASEAVAEAEKEAKLTPGLLARIQALEARCDAKDLEMQQLKLALDTVKAELHSTEARLREAKGKIKLLQVQIAEAERSLERVMGDRDEAIIRSEELAEEVDSLRHQLADLAPE